MGAFGASYTSSICNKMLDSVSISASLILLLFLLMQSEKQRRHDPLAGPHIPPTISTQQVRDLKARPANKHRLNKKGESVEALSCWEC